MSEDEGALLVFSLIVAAITWCRWWFLVMTRAPLGAGLGIRAALAVAPIACMLALLCILKFFAASDVRDDGRYLALYTIAGAAWVGLTHGLIGSMGVSLRDDSLERRNPAATTLIIAALLAFTLCFAGANIGDGPGWWVVIFSAGLSTATLAILWATVQRATALADAVTIERNMNDAWRAGAFLIASGLILGRSVAGTWISALETIKDFVAMAWPAFVLTIAELVVGSLRNNDRVAAVRCGSLSGVIIGLAYLAAAIGYVIYLGWWT